MRMALGAASEAAAAELEAPAAKRSLSAEAEHCRREAVRFAGRPEQALLVKLAHAFEMLDSRRCGNAEPRSRDPRPGRS